MPAAPDTFTLSGLVRKRSELAGDVRTLEQKLEQLRADIQSLDSAIRIMSPDYRVDGIVPKVRRQGTDWFAKGELLRMTLDTLRKAPEAMSTREIALGIMERKGLDTGDAAMARTLEKRVDATLRKPGRPVERVAYGVRSVGWKVRQVA